MKKLIIAGLMILTMAISGCALNVTNDAETNALVKQILLARVLHESPQTAAKIHDITGKLLESRNGFIKVSELTAFIDTAIYDSDFFLPEEKALITHLVDKTVDSYLTQIGVDNVVTESERLDLAFKYIESFHKMTANFAKE